MKDIDMQPATQEIKSIYDSLDKLTIDELSVCLTTIGQTISDTAEFNFYGAHLIDFDSLVSLQRMNSHTIINLPDFIAQLDKG